MDWESKREEEALDHCDPREDQHIDGYCGECHEHVTSVTQDDGIGEYEYWGAKGTHHDYVEVSPCCAADVIDHFEGDDNDTDD